MQIDGYTIIEEIGKGASGYVYKAMKGTDEYAIKICTGFDSESRKRFGREIRIAEALQHPNIIKVYGSSMDATNPYFAMELCDCSIDKVIPNMTFSEQVALGIKICEGIQALHNASILHRDIKPSNILVKNNEIKITDFSFGFFLNQDSTTITSSDQVIGTQGYIAPEIFTKGGHLATVSSDIYSIGCTLFFIFSQGVDPTYFSPKNLHPNIARIIEKCRESTPSDRYHTAAEVIDELRLFQQPIQYLSVSDLLSQKDAVSKAEFRSSAFHLLLNHKRWDELIEDIILLGAVNRKDILLNYPEAGEQLLLLLENIYNNDHVTWRQYEDIDPYTDFCAEIFASTKAILSRQKAIELSLKFAVDNTRWYALRVIKNQMLAQLNDDEVKQLTGYLLVNKELLDRLEDEISELLPNRIRIAAQL